MRKFTLLLIGIIIAFSSLSAQQKGQRIIGGSFDFTTQKSTVDGYETRITQVLLTPMVGKMINDKIALGVGFGVGYSKTKMPYIKPGYGYGYDKYTYKYQEYNMLSLAPFIRIHENITDNFKFYIEPGISAYMAYSSDFDIKNYTVGAGVDVGLLYFLSSKVSMELNVVSLYYSHLSDKDDDIERDELSMEYNLSSPSIGIKYYF